MTTSTAEPTALPLEPTAGSVKARRPLSKPTAPPVPFPSSAPPDPGAFKMIERHRIEPSPWNPRKGVGDTTELQASIREKGILQPLVVRLWKGTTDRYEIVCGERRWTAASAIGLEQLPCIVRVLTDQQALECMLIENKDRADVHPLDEAEAFRILVEDFKVPEEQVADRVGKSVAHVHRRLRLAKLCPEAQDALRKGTLGAPAALVICQLQDPADQKDAVQALRPQPWEGNQPKSANEAKRVISTLLRVIKDAPFDPEDKGLVSIAGACSACPKNTAQQRGLFEELDKSARCTDGVCWSQKVRAHSDAQLQKLKAKGVDVVDTAKGAKEYFNQHSPAHLDGKWVNIEDTTYLGTGGGAPKKYKSMLPETVKPTAVLNPHTGVVVQVVSRDVAEKARRAAERSRPSSGEKAKKNPAQLRWELDQKASKVVSEQLLPKLIEKMEAMTPAAALQMYVLAQLESEHTPCGAVAIRRGLLEKPAKGEPNPGKAKAAIIAAVGKEKNAPALIGWLVELNAGAAWDTRLRDALSRRVKLDTKALRAAAKKSIVAAERQKLQEKKAAQKAKKSTPKKAAPRAAKK